MMLFWSLAALLTAAVVAALIRPLLHTPPPLPERGRYDLEVYRDQLAEIDRDLARGVIADTQAEAARIEVSRRILAVAEPPLSPNPAAPARTASRRLAATLLVALPLGTLTLYLALGRPDLPDLPLAARATPTAQASGSTPPDVLTAVAHLAERLKTEPNNLEGWVLLAQSLGKLGRLADAVTAWHQAAALAPADDEITGNLAEALTAANQDTVPDEARRLFEAVQARHAADPRAAHYLALARAQAGDFRGALDRWVALAAASPANAPWLPLVQRRIEDMAGQLKLDPATVIPKPLPALNPSPTAATAPATASPDTSTTPEAATDQQAPLIRSMVGKLEAKLEANPGDIDGWLRLAHAYQILADSEKERAVLKRALAHAPRNAEVLVAYAGALLAQLPSAETGTTPTDPLPAEISQTLRLALESAPDNQAALWYLGLDAANRSKPDEARALWQRLLATLDPASPESAEVKARLAALK